MSARWALALAGSCAGCTFGADGIVGTHGTYGGGAHAALGQPVIQAEVGLDVATVATHPTATATDQHIGTLLDASARSSIPSWFGVRPVNGSLFDGGLSAGAGVGLDGDGALERAWVGAWGTVRLTADRTAYPALHVELREIDYAQVANATAVMVGVEWQWRDNDPLAGLGGD